MQKRSLAVALALTLPLAFYGIPYAYAATSSAHVVNFSYTTTGSDPWTLHLFAACPSGEYVTGGGYGEGNDFTGIEAIYNGPASATSSGFDTGSEVFLGTANAWTANFLPTNLKSYSVGDILTVFAVCQAPITVAGIGVPEFGSLYAAVALGAIAYFMLSRRSLRSSRESMTVQSADPSVRLGTPKSELV